MFFSEMISFQPTGNQFVEFDDGINELILIQNNLFYLIGWSSKKQKIFEITKENKNSTILAARCSLSKKFISIIYKQKKKMGFIVYHITNKKIQNQFHFHQKRKNLKFFSYLGCRWLNDRQGILISTDEVLTFSKEFKLLLLCVGKESNIIEPIYINNNHFLKLERIKLTYPVLWGATKIEETRAFDKQIRIMENLKIVKIYKKKYLLHLVHVSKFQEIHLHDLDNVESKYICLKLPSLKNHFSINIVDNLILIHNFTNNKTIVYDFISPRKLKIITNNLIFKHSKINQIFLNSAINNKNGKMWEAETVKEKSKTEKVVKGSWFRKQRVGDKFNQTGKGQRGRERERRLGRGEEINCVARCFYPNTIFLPNSGIVGKLNIDFEIFINNLNDKNGIMELLFRRSESKLILLNYILQEIKNYQELRILSKYFNLINKKYVIYNLKKSYFQKTTKHKYSKSSEQINTNYKKSTNNKLILKNDNTYQHSYPNIKYFQNNEDPVRHNKPNSSTYKKKKIKMKKTHIKPEGGEEEIIHRINNRNKKLIKGGSEVNILNIEDTNIIENEKNEILRNIVFFEINNKKGNSSYLEANVKNRILQRDIYTGIFLKLSQENIRINYIISIILEYIRSLELYNLKAHFLILKHLVKLLLIEKKINMLIQFLESRLIPNSKTIAIYLIQIHYEFEPLLLLACKMLLKMKKYEKLINALVDINRIDLILKLIPKQKIPQKCVITLLKRSLDLDNINQFINIFEYYQDGINDSYYEKLYMNFQNNNFVNYDNIL
ncbi:colon cancer-associated protein mic1 [Anaeramoeba flamelloides]|uniref:Colon cancer-associated protein mic1 n=1 Tax=Anaeramoeba flamelloides TaxID=1746091 RepID=A0AAV8AAD0_9EUKA|nr:colon cancer-associated protein mic1 [Anaeramoeba flamelloides]